MHTPEHVRRAPREYASALLEVARGCTWNRCVFCNLYHGVDFHMVPIEHIVEDLDEIAATTATGRPPQRMLLLGGNVAGLPNDELIAVLDLVREKLPSVTEISGYIRTADIKLKSDRELAELVEHGLTDVTIGTECGWDPALRRMRKGHTAADILEQYPRLTAAGIAYAVFYLAGFAGAGKCEESAHASAEVFNQLCPTHITVMTMTPYPGSQLREEVEAGSFTLAPESEVMRDAAAFIGGLDIETFVVGSHDSNLFRIDGALSRDREGMVATLLMRAERVNDAAMGALRMKMRAM